MSRKNDRPDAKPYAVSVLGITAITLISLLVGAYILYSMVIGKGKDMEAPLPVPHLPPVSEATALGTYDYRGTVKTLDSAETKMSAFKGKVIFLNFWASWCPPCIVELPSIQRLHSAVKGDGDIALIIASTESADTIRSFLGQRNYDFPAYIADAGLLDAFRVTAYPATFILDATGRILYKHMGAAKWDDPAVKMYLDRLAQPLR